MWVVWSNATVAWVTGNQPTLALPAPWIAVVSEIVVHTWSPSLLQMPLEEAEDLAPTVHRLLGTVERALVVEEPVAGAVVAVELVRLAVPLQLRLMLVDLLGRRVLVLVAEEP